MSCNMPAPTAAHNNGCPLPVPPPHSSDDHVSDDDASPDACADASDDASADASDDSSENDSRGDDVSADNE